MPRPADTSRASLFDLQGALAQWRAILGTDRVLTDDLSWYERSTSGLHKTIAAVLKPETIDSIAPILRIAGAHRVPLWPVSSGRNWGYGAAHPVLDGNVVVDLSALARIRAFDPELGLVTVEPGVTQGQLAQFLADGGHPFMAPTTGAGPSCSVLSNALERGFGLSPTCDHFAAVTAIEATLPDGRGYRSPLLDIGADQSAGAYKWGFGPYLDGLFAQGAFGIVTAATLSLARRPQATRMILFQLRAGHDVAALVERGRAIMQAFPGVVTSLKLTNRRLAMATTQPYPAGEIEDGVVAQATLERFGRSNGVGEWLGIVALHGEGAVVAAAARGVRTRLGREAQRFLLVSPARLRLAGGLRRALGRLAPATLVQKLDVLRRTLGLMQGRPDDLALRLAYWRSPAAAPATPPDPARDGCGILWYAPVVPIKGDCTRRYVDMVERVLRAHRFEPLITLTTVSPTAFDSTVPVLFDASLPEETRRAHACHAALLDEGLALGFAPYRHGVQSMDWLDRHSPGFMRLVGALKNAVDPAGILAPGRYAPPRTEA